MKKIIIVNSDFSLSDAIGEIRELYKIHPYVEISLQTGKKRSLTLSAVSFRWYLQISRELREYTADQIRCLCKLHRGMPILRGDDPEYHAACVKVIDPLPYDLQLEAMLYWPVTRLMKSPQMLEYLDSVQANYALRGVILKYSEDENG